MDKNYEYSEIRANFAGMHIMLAYTHTHTQNERRRNLCTVEIVNQDETHFHFRPGRFKCKKERKSLRQQKIKEKGTRKSFQNHIHVICYF